MPSAAVIVWIKYLLLRDRQGYPNKTCFGQKQDDSGIARRNSNNVKGWSGNGNVFLVSWTLFISQKNWQKIWQRMEQISHYVFYTLHI